MITISFSCRHANS